MHNELECHKLDSLRKYCNLSSDNAHSAAKDVFDLAIVYNKFKENKTVEELYDISFHYFPFENIVGKTLERFRKNISKTLYLKRKFIIQILLC